MGDIPRADDDTFLPVAGNQQPPKKDRIDQPLPPPGRIRSARDLQLPDSQPIEDRRLGPDVEPNQTLNNIEDNVRQYEDSSPAMAAPPDTDSARKAVDEAVAAAGEDLAHPEPIQALNAQPFPSIDHASGAPPVLPPPLDFSQFPVPPADDNKPAQADNVPPLIPENQ